ncbi:hypothetical protein HDU92_005464 [Lobulomyces angularis]|nr:hypothetical protein HDU92_005464 [Lobulomyces angularis]
MNKDTTATESSSDQEVIKDNTNAEVNDQHAISKTASSTSVAKVDAEIFNQNIEVQAESDENSFPIVAAVDGAEAGEHVVDNNDTVNNEGSCSTENSGFNEINALSKELENTIIIGSETEKNSFDTTETNESSSFFKTLSANSIKEAAIGEMENAMEKPDGDKTADVARENLQSKIEDADKVNEDTVDCSNSKPEAPGSSVRHSKRSLVKNSTRGSVTNSNCSSVVFSNRSSINKPNINFENELKVEANESTLSEIPDNLENSKDYTDETILDENVEKQQNQDKEVLEIDDQHNYNEDFESTSNENISVQEECSEKSDQYSLTEISKDGKITNITQILEEKENYIKQMEEKLLAATFNIEDIRVNSAKETGELRKIIKELKENEEKIEKDSEAAIKLKEEVKQFKEIMKSQKCEISKLKEEKVTKNGARKLNSAKMVESKNQILEIHEDLKVLNQDLKVKNLEVKLQLKNSEKILNNLKLSNREFLSPREKRMANSAKK